MFFVHKRCIFERRVNESKSPKIAQTNTRNANQYINQFSKFDTLIPPNSFDFERHPVPYPLSSVPFRYPARSVHPSRSWTAEQSIEHGNSARTRAREPSWASRTFVKLSGRGGSGGGGGAWWRAAAAGRRRRQRPSRRISAAETRRMNTNSSSASGAGLTAMFTRCGLWGQTRGLSLACPILLLSLCQVALLHYSLFLLNLGRGSLAVHLWDFFLSALYFLSLPPLSSLLCDCFHRDYWFSLLSLCILIFLSCCVSQKLFSLLFILSFSLSLHISFLINDPFSRCYLLQRFSRSLYIFFLWWIFLGIFVSFFLWEMFWRHLMICHWPCTCWWVNEGQQTSAMYSAAKGEYAELSNDILLNEELVWVL